ncbi:MAG: acyl-CoA thioesterase [Alcaligenaceae bacterium]|nr:acyl-CoA thioesterase [Alcaligenaceae bacterium]
MSDSGQDLHASGMLAPFKYYLCVRYGECDAQNVVFNARYGDYIDVACMEFFRSLGYTHGDDGLEVQLVKQTTEWMAASRYHDILEISLWVSKVGNTSFIVQAEFRHAGREKVVAQSETVYVRVHSSTKQKFPLTPEMKTKLLQGAPGIKVDHAGMLT